MCGVRRNACVIVLLLMVGAAPSAEIIDRIVAVVAGQILTKSDVDAAAAFGLAPNLEALIDRTLMLSEVRRVAPPEPDPAALDARIERARTSFATAQAFARALEVSGWDESVLRAFLADDLRLARYLEERFSNASQPTEDEIREAGEAARERLTAARREALVNAWIAELRRRTDMTMLR